MSVLRYVGGKTKLASKIIPQIERRSYDLSLIVSPFFGGGSIEFILNKKYGSKVIANDKFSPLINFWYQLQQNRQNLVEYIKEVKSRINKDVFYQLRTQVLEWLQNKDEDKDLVIASYYFALNRSSFSGSTLSGGFSSQSASGRFTKSSIDKLSKINLNDFSFYNLDFVDFLSFLNNDIFIYLDPPYYLSKTTAKLYGVNGDLHENFNHNLLWQTLKTKPNWALSYNDCPEIRELYKDYEIINLEAQYSMNKSKKGQEILIFSNTR